ncbi:sigma-70 family RNA polymerase sigma factor [Massilia pinisoli]|uniref:Sigma-70 family RNA polymerase sigma factor n=1 Tax=Massilia pinisoli TaxID=1772194 RepID=A0ABT1ZXN8_9BURK|nr:sigma-70 family RNA polymerase sigma factor [Massilia pinisoli]MCS0584688.1 sigma-70 family RNA polymerase sigma factor [Massilia pinisoli]
MREPLSLSERFEASRKHLRSVALRMLGNAHEADDAVQEAWLRLARSDTDDVANLPGWLTTVVARICLDMLRARTARAEEPIDPDFDLASDDTPEQEVLRVDAIGLAMLVVLDRLTPSERLAFVLHDLFDVAFEDIATILDKTPEAARQLASRARRRVRDGDVDHAVADRQWLIESFLVAARGGDMTGLLRVLDPNVVFRADAAAVTLGSLAEIRGAGAVAEAFKGQAHAAWVALLDGELGVAVVPENLLLVLRVEVRDGRIVAIDAVADRTVLDAVDVVVG